MAIATKLLKVSRTLRKNQTPWEKKLWRHLRAGRFRGSKFKRQVVIGNYIVDFCCFEKKLILEVDGSQHTEDRERRRDLERENFLKSKGYTILRFWDNEVENNLDGVLEKIRMFVKD